MAQSKTNIETKLKELNIYSGLSNSYFVGVWPIKGCNTCDITMVKQMKEGLENNKDVVIIYPTARALVQQKVKRENGLDTLKVKYIFDSEIHEQLSDAKKPKGYVIQLDKK